MSPETEANDHVPLEFLLGARAKNYLPNASATSLHRRSNNANAKRIFTSSIHPRRREEQARHLLRRVLEQDVPRDIDGLPESSIQPLKPDKTAVMKAIMDAASESLANQEDVFDPESFQLNFVDVKRSPGQFKAPRRSSCEDLARQEQRINSFHGFKQDDRSFLDVAGAAARIPKTTTRQLRDLKLDTIKARKKLEGKRTQELIESLQQQQAYTRTALRHHQQLVNAELSVNSTSPSQKQSRTALTRVVTLDTTLPNENPDAFDRNETGYEEKMHGSVLLQQYQESNYEHMQLLSSPPRRLATLQLDGRALNNFDTVDSDDCTFADFADEEEGQILSQDDNDEQTRRRLNDCQRQVFVNSAANGLFLGGGFIAKKTKTKTNSTSIRLAQPESEREFLDMVLGAQSASILPLAVANKPALRRRNASAGHRRPQNQPLKDK